MENPRLKLLTGTAAVAKVKEYRGRLEAVGRRCKTEKDYPFSWILGEVRQNRMQVRVTPDTMFLTQIQLTPGQRVFLIFAVISDDLNMELINPLIDLARNARCKVVRFYGRKGWFRRFPDADHSAMITIEV